jgi:hypothetical protein
MILFMAIGDMGERETLASEIRTSILSCYKFGEPDDKSKIRENYSEIFV